MLKNTFIWSVIALAVAAVPQDASADIFRNISDLEESEVFGQSSVFDSVGLLTGSDANGDSFIAGTGVLIHPEFVLTAGHVTFDEPNLPWESLQFNPSADVGSNLMNFLDINEVFVFPGFTGSEAGGGTGNDIALVRLSNPILDITPAQLFMGNDNDLIGAEFITAGYGNPGIFGQPLGAFDGIRRGSRNIIESAGANFPQVTVEDQFFVSDFDFLNVFDPLELEGQGSQNASGQGWFVDVNGEYQIAGIVNGGLSNDLNTFGIRTALYNDFINDTIQSNSVPEPGTMGLLTLGLLGVGMRRRKA